MQLCGGATSVANSEDLAFLLSAPAATICSGIGTSHIRSGDRNVAPESGTYPVSGRHTDFGQHPALCHGSVRLFWNHHPTAGASTIATRRTRRAWLTDGRHRGQNRRAGSVCYLIWHGMALRSPATPFLGYDWGMDRRQKSILARVAGVFVLMLGAIVILPALFVVRSPPPVNTTAGLIGVGLFGFGAILFIIGWENRGSDPP